MTLNLKCNEVWHKCPQSTSVKENKQTTQANHELHLQAVHGEANQVHHDPWVPATLASKRQLPAASSVELKLNPKNNESGTDAHCHQLRTALTLNPRCNVFGTDANCHQHRTAQKLNQTRNGPGTDANFHQIRHALEPNLELHSCCVHG